MDEAKFRLAAIEALTELAAALNHSADMTMSAVAQDLERSKEAAEEYKRALEATVNAIREMIDAAK